MPLRTRVFRAAIATASAVILLLSVTGWAASQKYLSALSTVNVFGGLSGNSVWGGDPVNILLVGSDDRSGLSREQRRETHITGQDFGRHTDTILLVHLGGDLGQVTVVSIPRDSLAAIPAHTSDEGEQIEAHQGKINSAFATGGPAVTVQTVQEATGLTIDHYVEVDFGGFLNMVDAVGGVEVCLPEPLYDERAKLDLPAGRQTIDGPQALAFVRARYIDNDFGRSGRQQKFLSAMAQKVTSAGVLLNPVALNGLIDAVANSVTTDERLTADSMAALAARAADLDLGRIVFTTVPVSDGDHMHAGESTVLWDDQGAAALFAALRDDQPLPKPPKVAAVEVGPGEIHLDVVGSSSQAGAAVTQLTEAGYQVTTSPGADTAPTTTTVRYDPVYPRSLLTLKAALPEAQFIADSGRGEVFAVTFGSDFTAITPVRSAATSVAPETRTAKDDLCS